jgi:hypothetical protein
VGTNAPAVVPKAVPAAPAGLSATPGDGALALSWTEPASNGSPITGYTVTGVPVGGGSNVTCTATPPATQCTISGLTNGVAHDLTVVATNAVGNSLASTPVRSAASTWPLLTLPLPQGGQALVQVSGAPPACVLVPGSAQIEPSPAQAPAGASFPFGAFGFSATGCANATLAVEITYPQALTGLQLKKWGPATAGAAPAWFEPSGLSLSNGDKTVRYSVVDNGSGDSNPALGDITDPFAPMAMAVAAPTAVPSLGEWATLLLALFTAALGVRGLQVRRP